MTGYHWKEALEWSIDLLSLEGPNSDSGSLGEGTKVIGLLDFVLSCP